MKLFEIMFTEINGERGYGDIRYVMAEDLDTAAGFANKLLLEYFGEGETDIFQDYVESACGGYTAKLEYVKETDSFVVGNVNGGETRLYLVEEKPQGV